PGLFIFNFQLFALKLWSTAEAVAVFSAAHQLYYSAISVFSMTTVLSSVVISERHTAMSKLRNVTVLTNLRTNSMLVAFSLVLVTTLLVPVGQFLFPSLPFEK